MKPDLAVTISSGPAYATMAELVVPRVRELLGLDVSVELLDVVQAESEVETKLANMRQACKVKLDLLNRYPDRRLLFFDLDWVPLRRWDWDVVGETDAFVAVRSQMRPDRLNGGFWIASPKHAPIFQRALELWAQLRDPKTWTWEEPFLQRALNESGADVLWLPESYNREGDGGDYHAGDYAAHPCRAPDKLKAVRDLIAAGRVA